ncbi:hypothetical protein [Halorhabdus amylolytica]|uniref:hypothetical protein n=1 Tax=Halorhabdus amylolytica TaxID=2559573 RepID=UPI0010AB1A45|nr:hypothetical protein [Halorhabdus amylolytica]
MAPRDRYLLLFALGLVLVVNPVYLFPNGVPREEAVTYRAEQIETVEDAHNELPVFAVLDCARTITHRECVQARQVGYDGRLAVDTDTEVVPEDDETGLYFGYDYVRFAQGYAKPNASLDDGTLVLSFGPVSRDHVLGTYAFPFDEVPPLGKRAIRNGTASTTRLFTEFDDIDPIIDEEQRLVNRSGTFYRLELEKKVSNRQFPPWILGMVRIIGVIGGGALAFLASGRYTRLSVSTHGARE